MLERVTFTGSTGTTVCDSRFMPIVVLQWFELLDLASVDLYTDWCDRLLARMDGEGLRGVLIYDLRAIERPPSAVRRRIAERREPADPLIRRVMLDELAIIDNPLIRGAATAIRWLNPKVRSTAVATVDKALVRARECLSDHGIAVPIVSPSDFDIRPDAALRKGAGS